MQRGSGTHDIYLFKPRVALMDAGCVKEIGRHAKDLGAKEEDLELLAKHAMQDVCRLTNPRDLSKEEIIEIYRKTL